MTLVVDVTIESDGWSAVAGFPDRIETALAASAREAGAELAESAEVGVLLCDDAAIRRLNRTWRGVDKPTNVLSFPAAAPATLPAAPLLGDIVVAFETAAREAEVEGKTLSDHATHLVVHGFLHLLGHDHIEPEPAETMELLEQRILEGLGIADPYAGTLPANEAGP
jgi:probable rRNA maturation factor